jgi:hypothetical protein
MSTAAVNTLLSGVWEIRHIPLEGRLERLNLTQVSPRLYLGELHPQEGSTWAKEATHEYRVEFTGEGSTGVMSTRPKVAGEEWEKGAWEVYCPFHFHGPVEGLYMSSQGGCAWSVKAVDTPHPVRSWTLSRGGGGNTEPTFHTASWRAPVSHFLGLTSKWQQYLSIGALVMVQFGVRYFFKRFMNAPPAAAPASAADARAAREAARGKLSAAAAAKLAAPAASPAAAAEGEAPTTNSLENKKDL